MMFLQMHFRGTTPPFFLSIMFDILQITKNKHMSPATLFSKMMGLPRVTYAFLYNLGYHGICNTIFSNVGGDSHILPL
jgi:hypothetical protein